MFGKNPIRSISLNPDQLIVQDSFFTIQGEGPYSGWPALFIRLAGCNLACHFCDTEFESQIDNDLPVSQVIEQILDRFPRYQRRFVVLTGGEPLRQNPIRLLAVLLHHGTEMIQIETAGTLWQNDLTGLIDAGRVSLVCSPKTPRVHPMIEQMCKHWKYIIRAGEQDPTDGLPNRGTQPATKEKEQCLYRPNPVLASTIWVSPCDEYDPIKNKANQDAARDLCLTRGYRLSLQVHKIIGVE